VPADRQFVYCTKDDVEALLSAIGVDQALDDNNRGTLAGEWEEFMNKGLQWSSARVDFYLNGQYQRRYLADSWLVNDWATTLCACWLRARRGNPVPGSLLDMCKGVIEDLKLVQSGQVVLSDVPLRAAAWPAWSNVRVDHTYELRKVRVERWISERVSGESPYPRDVDYTSEWIYPPL